MSLQVWLPLNGNLNNQGLSNVVVSGTPSYGEGKIGKGLDFINSQLITISCPNLNNVSKFSVCFWIKGTKDTNDGDWASPIDFRVNKSGSTENSDFRFGKDNRANVDGYPITMFNNPGYSIASSNSLTTSTANDWEKWIHICFITDGTNLKAYKDGVLVSSSSNGVNGYLTGIIRLRAVRYNGFLNDFRIYDHCLSPMEVKELAKGLVLHYPLNRQGWGQENLFISSSTRVPSAYNVSNFTVTQNINIPELGCTNGIKVVGSGGTHSSNIIATLGIGYGTSLNGVNYSYSIYMKNNHSTNKIAFSTNNGGIWSQWLNPGETKTLIALNAPGNGSSYVQYNFRTESTGAAFDFTIWNPKVEIGSIVTPWCPNSSDELATTMGLNSTIEYDCSGFGNNGIRYGTFNFNSDTPRYTVSTQYNGTDNTLKIPFDASIWSDNFTMSIWFKKDDLGSKNYETLFGGPSGFEMDTRSGSSSSLSIYMASNRGGNVYTGIEFGKWYMVTLVNDGTNELYYINGELVNTIAKNTIPVGDYWIGSWKDATSQNYKGLLSDARIYATALSADDIKSLYQNSAYIDGYGNIYGVVHEGA